MDLQQHSNEYQLRANWLWELGCWLPEVFSNHAFPILLISSVVQLLSHVQLFCDPKDCSPPGSFFHWTFQARILEWQPFPSPGDLLDPGIKPVTTCTGRRILYHWTTREAQDLFGTLFQNYETSAVAYGSEIFSKETLWPSISWNDCITNSVWQFFSVFEFFRVHGLIRENMYGRPSPLRHTVRGLTFLAPSASCLFPFPHNLLPNLGVA